MYLDAAPQSPPPSYGDKPEQQPPLPLSMDQLLGM